MKILAIRKWPQLCKSLLGRTASPSTAISVARDQQIMVAGLDNEAISGRFGRDITLPMLKQLMISAGYSDSVSETFLHWYRSTILTTIGPLSMDDKPCFDSFCNDDFSPIEFSRNFQCGTSTIRVGYEPIGSQAGRVKDPFNQVAAQGLLESLARQSTIVDLQWYHHFMNHFIVEQREVDSVVTQMAPNEHMSVTTVSFDLHPNQSSLIPKAYFYPIIKSLQTGIPGGELHHHGPYWANQTIILKRKHCSLECFSFDCTDPIHSRLKLYIRWKYTSINKTCDFYTLGGRLSGAAIEGGVQAIKILWPLLTGVTDPDEELSHSSHRAAGIIFNFELRPGHARPYPKVYIPVRHYFVNDLTVANALQAYFRQIGWHEQAANYHDDLKAAFPNQDFATTIGRHSYIGLTYSESTGTYLTAYYNTMLFSTGSERDEEGVLRGPAVKKQRHLHV